MKTNLLLFFFLFLVSGTVAQTLFNERYGTIHWDYGTAITSTIDGGFAVTGTTFGSGAGGDIFLMKINSQGFLQWTKNIFGVNNDRAVAIYQLANGNYIIGGQTYSYGIGCTSAIVIMLDSTGNVIWAHTYGDINCQGVLGFSQTMDGGFIGCGTAYGGGPGWLFKIDQNGNLQWSKSYQVSGLQTVKQTNDGGFIAVNRQAGIYILKTDSAGNPLWYKSYITSTGNTQSFYIEVLEDGSAVITGEVYYNAFGAAPDIYLLKIDADGNRIWFKTYGFTFFEYGLCVKQTLDNGFIITGNTNSFGHGDTDAFLLKTDSNGDFVWAKTYGEGWHDEAIQVETLQDSGFIIVGHSFINSIYQDSSYVYVVRTDKDGITSCNQMDWIPLEQTQVYDPTVQTTTATNICIDSICFPTVFNFLFAEKDLCLPAIVEEIDSNISIIIFPNPATTEATINFGKAARYDVRLCNTLGETLFKTTTSAEQIKIDVRDFPNGIYFVVVRDGENNLVVRKIVKM